MDTFKKYLEIIAIAVFFASIFMYNIVFGAMVGLIAFGLVNHTSIMARLDRLAAGLMSGTSTTIKGGMKLIAAFLVATAVAAMLQAVCGINPFKLVAGYLTGNAMVWPTVRQLTVIVIVWLVFWLWLTKTTSSRRLQKVVLFSCILSLLISGNPAIQDHFTSLWQRWEANLDRRTKQRDAALLIERAKQLDRYFVTREITQATYLMSHDDISSPVLRLEIKRRVDVRVGPNEEPKIDKHGRPHLLCRTEKNGRIYEGWVLAEAVPSDGPSLLTNLSEAWLQRKKSAVGDSKPAMARPVVGTTVASTTTLVVVKPQPREVLCENGPASPAARSVVKEDIVTVDSGGWKESEVVAYNQELIELGPFESDGDVQRLKVRSGGSGVNDLLTPEKGDRLTPVEIWNGKYVARVRFYGGNSLNAPLRLKVVKGPSLVVKVKKLSGYN